MLPPDFVIRNVDVWNHDELQTGQDVFVASSSVEKIVDTGGSTGSSEIFEGEGRVLMPLGVDNQVHLRCPGQYHKENVDSAAMACLRGGYGAILAMPNTFPTVDTPDRMQRCLQELAPAAQKYGLEFLQSAAMSHGLKSQKLTDMEALAQAGARAFTDDGVALVNDELQEAAFEKAAKLGLAVLQHAEWPGHGGALAEGGATQKKLKIPGYPHDAESKIVARDIALLEKHPKARYHVLHVTTKASVDLVKAAKKKGLHVSAEVSPHHLYFCMDDIPEDNTSFKMNPPLFTAQDRQALRDALSAGDIDFVATDHAPHEALAKEKEFSKAAFGTTGLECSLRVLLWALAEGILESPQKLVEVFSTAPASFLGLETKEGWGALKAGLPLRAVLLDSKAPPTEVSQRDLESLSKNCIFLGTKLPGKISGVFNPKGYFAF